MTEWEEGGEGAGGEMRGRGTKERGGGGEMRGEGSRRKERGGERGVTECNHMFHQWTSVVHRAAVLRPVQSLTEVRVTAGNGLVQCLVKFP